MSDFKIDIDLEEAERKLTIRERVGVYLLFSMFRMVYPAKYQHQVDKMEEALFVCFGFKERK